MRIRFYIEATDEHRQIEKQAEQIAQRICAAQNSYNSLTIVSPNRKLEREYLFRIFSEERCHELLRLQNPYKRESIFLETKRTIFTPARIGKTYLGSGILLVIGLSSQDLFEIDVSYYSIPAIIAISYESGGVLDWAKTWGAMNIETKNSELFPVPHWYVRATFRYFGSSMYKEYSYNPPLNEPRLKESLDRLRRASFNLDPKQIQAYLLREARWRQEEINKALVHVNKANEIDPGVMVDPELAKGIGGAVIRRNISQRISGPSTYDEYPMGYNGYRLIKYNKGAYSQFVSEYI